MKEKDGKKSFPFKDCINQVRFWEEPVINSKIIETVENILSRADTTVEMKYQRRNKIKKTSDSNRKLFTRRVFE